MTRYQFILSNEYLLRGQTSDLLPDPQGLYALSTNFAILIGDGHLQALWALVIFDASLSEIKRLVVTF